MLGSWLGLWLGLGVYFEFGILIWNVSRNFSNVDTTSLNNELLETNWYPFLCHWRSQPHLVIDSCLFDCGNYVTTEHVTDDSERSPSHLWLCISAASVVFITVLVKFFWILYPVHLFSMEPLQNAREHFLMWILFYGGKALKPLFEYRACLCQLHLCCFNNCFGELF